MNKRPLSLTIISWFFISLGMFTAVMAFFSQQSTEVLELMAQSKIPVNVQLLLSYIGTLVTLASGILILKAYTAGRHLYVGWSGLNIVIGIFSLPSLVMVIPSILFTAVFAYFLYRSAANIYFQPSEESNKEDQPDLNSDTANDDS